MALLVAVEGDDTDGFVVLTGGKDILEYLDYLLCLLGILTVYPLTAHLVSLDRTAVAVLGYVGGYLKVAVVEGIVREVDKLLMLGTVVIGEVGALVSRYCEVKKTVYLKRRLHGVVVDGIGVCTEITLHERSRGTELLIISRYNYGLTAVDGGDGALDEYLRCLVEDNYVKEVLR